METFTITNKKGKQQEALIIKRKSDTVFVIRWNEFKSQYNKLIDLQDPENCNK